MPGFRFPNETDEYREKRNALLEDEKALRLQIEQVAQKRRALGLGGALKEPYVFEQWNEADSSIRSISFDRLFGPHSTLLCYTMMFGAKWDNPCPSCTSIVDAIQSNARSVTPSAAVAVVANASPSQLFELAKRRGWSDFTLASGQNNRYLLDYCGYEGASDPAMVAMMNVFCKTSDGIFHFWGSELVGVPMESGHPRHMDMIWPLWNLLDMTPEGRGEMLVPKQNYEHRYFTENVLGG